MALKELRKKRLPEAEHRSQRLITMFTRDEVTRLDRYLDANGLSRSGQIREIVMSAVMRWEKRQAS